MFAFGREGTADVLIQLFWPSFLFRYCNRCREFQSSIGCQKKIVCLLDKTHLFKISNLVYDGRDIVRSLNSSLQEQVDYGGYSKLAGLSFVRVKIEGFGNFLR